MINETIFRVHQNPLLYQYLKYHSYWYKMLYRNPNLLNDMVNEMKEEYKLTTKDKIDSICKKMNFISNLLGVFG